MPRLRYIVSRLKKMSSGGMMRSVESVCQRSGKSKAAVMADMAGCALFYSAGYMDYDLFALENTNARQRRTFVVRGVNDSYVGALNEEAYRHIFNNKDEFNAAFEKYLGRDWLRFDPADPEAFYTWLKGRGVIIAKPRDGMCGKGVEKLAPADYPDPAVLFEHLRDNGCGVVEECLKQHPDMDAMYPGSVNTVRLVTVLTRGEVHLMCAYVRIGNGSHVDNFGAGGMLAKADKDSGVLTFDAVDNAGVIYQNHPVTGTKIKGFQVPLWAECVELAKQAALTVPQIGYVGWDIGITPEGPVLIEGNEFPGHNIYQIPAHTPDRTGLKPLFDAVIFPDGKKSSRKSRNNKQR